MKTSPRTIPLFRSEGQAAVLREVYLGHDGASLSDIATATGLSASTVHHEVERLEKAGVLVSRRVGRTRIVAPDVTSPIAHEVASLVRKTLGPPALVGTELRGVDGITACYIFGSWAKLVHGEQVPIARDIDVIVVGSPDEEEVFAACRRIEQTLRMDVNPVIVTPHDWDHPSTSFLRSVREGALEPVPIA